MKIKINIRRVGMLVFIIISLVSSFKEYQEKIAEGIVNGIVKYIDFWENRKYNDLKFIVALTKILQLSYISIKTLKEQNYIIYKEMWRNIYEL